MTPKHDWPAIAAEIAGYLDNLELKQRPMPLAYWALVLGISKSNLYGRHRTHPDCPFTHVWKRYRAIDDAWIAVLAAELVKRQGTRTGWPELAREYGMTYEQLSSLTTLCERRGFLKLKKRQPLSLERIVKTARVGMTRQDLADALGISIHRMESLLREDRATSPLTAALFELVIWEPRRGRAPSFIKRIKPSHFKPARRSK